MKDKRSARSNGKCPVTGDNLQNMDVISLMLSTEGGRTSEISISSRAYMEVSAEKIARSILNKYRYLKSSYDVKSIAEKLYKGPLLFYPKKGKEDPTILYNNGKCLHDS